jgi:hypothetical protein
MDRPQAAEHLEMVDGILRRAQTGSAPSLQFIVWGCVGVAFNVVGQLVGMGKAGVSSFWLAGVVLAAAIVVSAWDVNRMQRAAARQSTIGRLAAFSFWSAAGVMTVVTVTNQFTGLFPPFSPAVFYAAGMAIALLALGLGLRSKVMAGGGIALLIAIVAAFLVPVWL